MGHFSDLYQSGLRECACIEEQIYLRRNPFVNHWSTGADVAISLGFVFGLAVFALMYQTYLSVLIFRVLCDVTVRFVVCTVGKGRIKVQPENLTLFIRLVD